MANTSAGKVMLMKLCREIKSMPQYPTDTKSICLPFIGGSKRGTLSDSTFDKAALEYVLHYIILQLKRKQSIFSTTMLLFSRIHPKTRSFKLNVKKFNISLYTFLPQKSKGSTNILTLKCGKIITRLSFSEVKLVRLYFPQNNAVSIETE